MNEQQLKEILNDRFKNVRPIEKANSIVFNIAKIVVDKDGNVDVPTLASIITALNYTLVSVYDNYNYDTDNS